MRFGGHETFSVRDGWLHKGLKLLIERPKLLFDEHAADWLGVGQNMAKSLKHWLVATGLAQGMIRRGPIKNARLEETQLGRLIYECDPHLVEIGTWWALHVNLMYASEHAASWVWFFNSFSHTRFERAVCVESVRRHIQLSRAPLPSIRTLERDIGCLLQSYARRIPLEPEDPEESPDCPFTALGLLNYFRTSGCYQLNEGFKEIPPEILGYSLSRAFSPGSPGGKAMDIPLQEAARRPGGPGRAFVLSNETLFEFVLRAEGDLRDFEVVGLAGERLIRLRQRSPLEWLRAYYKRIDREAIHAA